MPQPNQSYYMRFLRCAKCSHNFEYDNEFYHPITLPVCDHTMYKECINIVRNQKKCSQDGISLEINHIPIDQLPINYSLLIFLYDSLPKDDEERYGRCPSYMKLDRTTESYCNQAEQLVRDISFEIKSKINNEKYKSIFSR